MRLRRLTTALITGAEPVKIAPIADIPENCTRTFALNGKSVLVVRTAAGVFAIENRCCHALPAMEGGKLRGFRIFCPAHGVRIDMRDGSVMGTLTTSPINVWETQIIDGFVHVSMDGA